MSLCRADKLLLSGGAAVFGGAALIGTPLGVGVPAALLAAALTDGIARPGSGLLYPTITHGPRDRPCVALTFDDGPDPSVTPAILDSLGAHGARATFFAIGRHLELHRELAKRLVADGHELGSHSWQHSRLQNFFGRARQWADMERSAQLIGQITGAMREPLYRPPIGLKSPPLARAAQARGLTMVAWSLHSRDTSTNDPERIASRVLSRIRPGDVVLMHDGHDLPGRHRPAVAQALPLILAGLHARNLQAVTVSELLKP